MDMKNIVEESLLTGCPLKIRITDKSKRHYYTKAEIILREDIQDFRQEGMSEEEIIKAFTATLWSLL